MTACNAPRHARPSRDIVIVDIDAASLAELGDWPWPRDVHASLMERLHASRARVVAFTAAARRTSQGTNEIERVRAALSLLEASNLGQSEQAEQLRALLRLRASGLDPDAHLAAAIKAHGNVILPVELRTDALTPMQPPALPARLLASSDPFDRRGRAGRKPLRPLPACADSGRQRRRPFESGRPMATAWYARM